MKAFLRKSSFHFLLFLSVFFNLLFFSCRTIPKNQANRHFIIPISRNLTDKGSLTAKQLADFFIKNNADEDYDHILEFAQMYIDEAEMENINSDIAFAQMCLETGFLKFGGLVQSDFHNYCGLGAIDSENPGEKFKTERLGIRAHIQHLHAYATTEDVQLNNELTDPRYSWPHRTKLARTIDELAGTWAIDPEYGKKLEGIIKRMSVEE